MITVGGGSVATPALTRAIREFGEQAKKQLDETGSLAGFKGEFTDDSSGGGSVTISISALGMAAYDASASKDDTFLAYTLTTAQPDGGGGTATSLSSGSSLTIRSDQDIDAFVAGFQQTAGNAHFGSFLYGSPEELAAVGMGPLPQPGDPDFAAPAAGDAGGKAAAAPSSVLFDKLRQKQAASSQLVGLLQSFLDMLGGKSKDADPRTGATAPADAGGTAENATRSRLARFTGTDVTT
jgi:hypothetical protein